MRNLPEVTQLLLVMRYGSELGEQERTPRNTNRGRAGVSGGLREMLNPPEQGGPLHADSLLGSARQGGAGLVPSSQSALTGGTSDRLGQKKQCPKSG